MRLPRRCAPRNDGIGKNSNLPFIPLCKKEGFFFPRPFVGEALLLFPSPLRGRGVGEGGRNFRLYLWLLDGMVIYNGKTK